MSEFNINEDAQSGASQSSCGEGQSGGGSQPIESSAFPDEDEETITMLDVIEREDKLEDEASAVLGFSDEKNCTYPKGYISRQALYSCATCSEGSDKQAAICLACSLECHENHELYELYTKRNYRCDCGNSKFKKGFECKLVDKQTKEAAENENNLYNHNFSGRYCICNKRYPPDENDDSAESNDEMWQCIACEDWYHTKHLGAKELPTKFDELVCGVCADKLEFIHYYRDIDKKIKPDEAAESKSRSGQVTKPPESLDETKRPQESIESEIETATNRHPVAGCSSDADPKPEPNSFDITTEKPNGSNPCESDTNDSQAENKDPIIVNESSECFLEKLKKETFNVNGLAEADGSERPSTAERTSQIAKGPLFWQDVGWRSMLCRCKKCLDMYKAKGCEYLIDHRDTVQYYEAQGRAMAKNRESPYERGMSALNRMNRAAVVEALHGYDELKADLSSYLKKFAETKKVVREEDIHDFFAQLKTKKRQKLEYD